MDPHFETTSPTEIPQKHSKAPFPLCLFLRDAGKVYSGEYETFSLTSCRSFGQYCLQITFRRVAWDKLLSYAMLSRGIP